MERLALAGLFLFTPLFNLCYTHIAMKKRIKNFLKLNMHVLAAFFIPVLILILAFAVTGIYPFGTQQIAVIDMYHQYVPFLGELQYKLQEGGSLFYTWNSGGGCNFWCLMSYYGASPLNLLLIFFPKTLLVEGVTVILLIKVGLTGSFMYTYLKNVQTCADELVDRKAGWKAVAFAVMYALCSYVIGYYWCIMWLEAVMLLPLCILGLSRLITDGRMVLYTVTLALIVFSNYYVAIMVCIFILVYYPVLYFTTVRGRIGRQCLFTTLRAVGCSLLGIAMAAVMMLPTYISMKSTYYFASEMPEDWSFYQDALNVINQLLPNAHITYIEGLPNLCCGLLVTLMLVFYYMSNRISLKEKALYGGFLVFMFFSLNTNKLDFIWHGMHFPNQLPHRFSFVICFVLVAMAYRAFKRIDSIEPKRITAVCVGFAGYYVLDQKVLAEKIDDTVQFLYFGLALLAAYGVVLALYRNSKITRKAFTLLVMIVVVAELSITTCMEYDKIGNSSRDTYNENKKSVTALGQYVAEVSGPVTEGGDGTFSRVEIDDAIIHNCPAFYHYRGMGQFSSTLSANTTELMEKIGLEGHPGSNRFNYNETSPVTSCITNVNYLIAKNRPIEDPDYTKVTKKGYSGLYKSNYPLSIGYMLPLSIKTWDPQDTNPFINLDEYVSAATEGEVGSVFISKGSGELEDQGISSYYESENDVQSTLLDGSSQGILSIKYTADTNEKYYVYVAATYADEIVIQEDSEVEDMAVQADCGSILNIGELKKGDDFSAKVTFDEGQAGRTTCYVYTLDYDAWNKAYEKISDNLMTVTEASDDSITGTVDVKELGVLVTSIPFEEGWSMKVDGKKRDIEELTGGAWISTTLDEGTHEIQLKFVPPGFIAGCIITVLSILVLIGATLLRGRRLRQESLPEESDCNIE